MIEEMSKTVAIIGASSQSLQVRQQGRPRLSSAQATPSIAINPNEQNVEGLPTYASVLDVPGPIDMATVYVQPDVGVRVMDELAKKGMPEVWLNPGADSTRSSTARGRSGLKTIQACSIIGIGDSPSRY